MKAVLQCPMGMQNTSDTPASSEPGSKERLLQELAGKLVDMGWFVAGSEGLRGTIDFLRQASADQVQGLINACGRRITDPPRFGRGSHPK